MRIISGIYKGRRFSPPKNLPVRPTTDMAKESLFNIMNNYYYFDEISVLDLFAGTGNISYEFASRGVPNIIAVDNNYQCIKYINATASEFEMPIHAIKSSVFKYLDQTNQKFTVIFADPPYDMITEDFLKIPELVFQNELLEDNGILVVEHSKHTDLSQHKHYAFSKSYGGNSFSFFEIRDN